MVKSERKKTKAEVMAEVIAKSKEHKVRVLPGYGLVGRDSDHFLISDPAANSARTGR